MPFKHVLFHLADLFKNALAFLSRRARCVSTFRCARRISFLIVCLGLSGALTGCAGRAGRNEALLPAEQTLATAETETAGLREAVQKETARSIDDVHLRDVDLLYDQTDPESVVTMYLTVSTGNEADRTDHTWEEINTYSAYDYEDWGVERYKVNALLQVGDENGPAEGELGYGRSVPNATVQIRGQTSSRYTQKNYKIKLRDNQGLWRDQQTIAVNKHQQDGLRFRNKLGFDLISEIPQIMGLRTQFVHLYVKDLTGEKAAGDALFEDYGLYTQVEQPNRKALRAHGLDRNGYLYKINFMEFYRYEDVIVPVTDPSYDKAAFDQLLECKGKEDHTKLIEMLEAVNNNSISPDELLDQWFDRENLAYWMAFMILTGNIDTQSRNMYLYSPLNSGTWYILPWDNDAFLMRTENDIKQRIDGGSWEEGVSNYWGNMLFRRALLSETFRQELDAAIEDLRGGVLSPENIRKKAQTYSAVVKDYVYAMPDAVYAPVTQEQYEEDLAGIAGEVEDNYRRYLDSLEKPLPFFVGTPVIEGDTLKLSWEVAYDFDAEDITYSVAVARDYDFTDVIFSQEDVRQCEASCALPKAGQYFLRVRAYNRSGRMQDSFGYYVNAEDSKIYGANCFYITDGGEVIMDEMEE